MILILEIPNADSLDKFRPIILGNLLFKIITNFLADRLSLIATKIIDPHQFGFIKGRCRHPILG